MAERKIYCPELDDYCTKSECSIKICVLRATRLADERWTSEWEAQQRQANREIAAWRAMCDLVDEHNALIDENKPGIARDSQGNIIALRLRLPKGKGSKLKRQAMISRILTSNKEDTVVRVASAMDAIIREEKARLLRSGKALLHSN
jgi:hypothetical protein